MSIEGGSVAFLLLVDELEIILFITSRTIHELDSAERR